MNLKEYKALIKSFDATYHFSDDFSVWRAGNNQEKKILEHKNDTIEHLQAYRQAFGTNENLEWRYE